MTSRRARARATCKQTSAVSKNRNDTMLRPKIKWVASSALLLTPSPRRWKQKVTYASKFQQKIFFTSFFVYLRKRDKKQSQ